MRPIPDIAADRRQAMTRTEELSAELADAVCAAYVSGRSVTLLASDAGVPRATVHRWLKQAGVV